MNKVFETIDALDKLLIEDEDPTRYGVYKPGDIVEIQDVYTNKYYGKFRVVKEMDPTRSRELYGSAVVGYNLEIIEPNAYAGEHTVSNNYRMRPYKETVKESTKLNKKKLLKEDIEVDREDDGIHVYMDMFKDGDVSPQSEYDKLILKYMDLRQDLKKNYKNYSKEERQKIDDELTDITIKAESIPEDKRGPIYQDFLEIKKANKREYDVVHANEIRKHGNFIWGEDKEFLDNNHYTEKLNDKIKDFQISNDLDKDIDRLEDIFATFFYDEVGIFNENIDLMAYKWAHDKIKELYDVNWIKDQAKYSFNIKYNKDKLTESELKDGIHPFNEAWSEAHTLLEKTLNISKVDIKAVKDSVKVIVSNLDKLGEILKSIYNEKNKINESYDSELPFDSTPEEIDSYYSDQLYKKGQKANDSKECFENMCCATATNHMSAIDDELNQGYLDMMVNEAKRNYQQNSSPEDRDKYNDEDFAKEIIYHLENEGGKHIEIVENDNINEGMLWGEDEAYDKEMAKIMRDYIKELIIELKGLGWRYNSKDSEFGHYHFTKNKNKVEYCDNVDKVGYAFVRSDLLKGEVKPDYIDEYRDIEDNYFGIDFRWSHPSAMEVAEYINSLIK